MTPEARRESYPSMTAIVQAWSEMPVDKLELTFPQIRALWIGWAEPFCFRCGLLPPIDDTRKRAWGLAGGWLDRAHLQDRDHGGTVEPLNLVPLCPLCHEQQPECHARQDGIAFVAVNPHRTLQTTAQLLLQRDYAGQTNPGKKRALRWLLRSFAEAGEIWASAQEQAS